MTAAGDDPVVQIEPVDDVGRLDLSSLVAAAASEGFVFVARLQDDIASGANRFSAPGEGLFAAYAMEEDGRRRVVGTCGLNADPFSGDAAIGRVRRLYVRRSHRGRGVGADLLAAVVQAWRDGPFTRLVLRTPKAAGFFERHGFVPVTDLPDATHELADGA